MTNLDRINTHSHNDVENTVETILHPDDLPNVFNRVPLYRNEINAIIAVPQDERKRIAVPIEKDFNGIIIVTNI